MKDFKSLSHVRWECKYHVVFIPKYRRKVIYGKLRALYNLGLMGIPVSEASFGVGLKVIL